MNMINRLLTPLRHIGGELAYGIRLLCPSPTPGRRLAAALILIIVFGGLNIWYVVSSIYNIGRSDARKERMELQHIRPPELKRDSLGTCPECIERAE